MTFLVSPSTAWFMAIVCALGGALWIWLEFRRRNRRQWPARIAAAALAVLALAALGLRPAAAPESSNLPPAPETAALWTPSLRPAVDHFAPRDVAPERSFALSGAMERPADARVIPDVAYISREHPNVKTLHVFGDGVSEYDAHALRGMRVIFHPDASTPTEPAITFVRLPREVFIGDPIVAQGRVQGIAPESSPTISLTAPDGTKRAMPLRPGPDGAATFALSAAPAVTTGRYVWKLELRAGEAGDVLAREEVGVSVIQPVLPRILMLEASPRFDTGRLKRWLGERGAELTVRTQLGRDHYRISTMHGSRDAVEAIDAGALAVFDLVLVDAGALAALSDAERAALQTAVSEDGLGVLIVADETLFAAAAAGGLSPDALLFPWKLQRGATDIEADSRLSRLHWPGSEAAPPEALPVPNFEIERAARLRSLVHDGQNRTLVAVAARGRGRLALSLVTESWRWTQQRDATPFAAFWTFLFSELARRDAGTDGRWSIASNGAGPQFVNAPLILRWTGALDRAPAPAQVSAEGEASKSSLALAQNPVDSRQWQAAYWPRRAGWHQVVAPGGATMDFYVSESAAWRAVQATRRQAATSRIAAAFMAGDAISDPAAIDNPDRIWSLVVLRHPLCEPDLPLVRVPLPASSPPP